MSRRWTIGRLLSLSLVSSSWSLDERVPSTIQSSHQAHLSRSNSTVFVLTFLSWWSLYAVVKHDLVSRVCVRTVHTSSFGQVGPC
ncbi:hypothetical protein LY78DRAFT_660587 [Colletotrichum sublineola]|nr:hypothetical protein LY78DRAFT_660587 [Colletotrichum sublineola]